MIVEILKIQKQKSKLPDKGDFWYIFFKDTQTLASYKTCIYQKFRNYNNWKEILNMPAGTKLENLILKGKNLIDADSQPRIIRS